MQIYPGTNQTSQNGSYKPRPVNYILKEKLLIIYFFFIQFIHIIVVRVFFHYCSLIVDYFNIVTKRVANETKIEIPENHNPVLVPTSEFFALVLLGVT